MPYLHAIGRCIPRTPRSVIAIGWAVVTLVVAAATAPAQGIGRDECVYLPAGESYAAFWGDFVRSPARAVRDASRYFRPNREHPPLTKTLIGATHALFTNGLGVTSHLQGARFAAFLLSALLSWLLAWVGYGMAGPGAGLLAPALFWAVPRHFYHAHPAALDLAITTLWVATVLAYRAAFAVTSVRRAIVPVLLTAFVFGLSVSAKHNAWFLLPLLGLHWALTRVPSFGRGTEGQGRAAPLALAAMAILGPLVLFASWPWLWQKTIPRLQEYFAFHLHHEHYPWHYLGRLLREPPFPIAYPFVVTALTVPAALLWVLVGGLVHGVARVARAVLGDTDEVVAWDELLLVMCALFPIVLIAWPTVPIFGGVKHWMPAMPFLALLGARALVVTGRVLWPARAGRVTAALALLVLAPAVRSVIHFHPYGTAAYGDLAGGAPGAATLGMQRQFWGDNVVGVLDELRAHAKPGARIWWQETAPIAVLAWQRDGQVRPDLSWVEGPEQADISIWQYHHEFRDKEFRTWTAFATPAPPGEAPVYPRPVTGIYLDEVPLVQVYARPGAWR